MFIIKKLIILSSDDNKASGVLKLEDYNNKISCDVKLFGVGGDCFLALKNKADIVYCEKADNNKIYFPTRFDLNLPMQAIVFDSQNIICKGSNSGQSMSYNGFFTKALEMIDSRNFQEPNDVIDETNTIDKEDNKNKQDNDNQQLTDKADSEVTKTNDMVMTDTVQKTNNNNSVEHQPKEFGERIVDNSEQIPISNDKENASGSNNSGKIFFEQISEQMQELFDTYPQEKELELIIPQSRWVRVPTDDRSYYVVGVVFDKESPQFICYGVPDKNNNKPPQCKMQARQWLELEKGGRGYWMMYQDAISGQTLEATMM